MSKILAATNTITPLQFLNDGILRYPEMEALDWVSSVLAILKTITWAFGRGTSQSKLLYGLQTGMRQLKTFLVC